MKNLVTWVSGHSSSIWCYKAVSEFRVNLDFIAHDLDHG